MGPLEVFLTLALVGGGIALAGFTISTIASLIKFRIERRYGGSSEENQKLQQHLKEMQTWRIKAEKRMQNLEQIVTDEDALQQLSAFKQPLLDTNESDDNISQSGTVPNHLRKRS